MRCVASVGDREFRVEISRRGAGRYAVRLDGRELVVESRGTRPSLVLWAEGRIVEATVAREGDGAAVPGAEERAYAVTIGGRTYPVRIADPLRRAARAAPPRREGRAEVRAVMPGRVTALLVREGQEVRRGQGVIVVEAMKMENEIPAPKEGKVVAVSVATGETVEAGAVLLSVE
ncbi:MAG: biotin/lipoyl-containing protein [Acidobacteriota bacterium]